MRSPVSGLAGMAKYRVGSLISPAQDLLTTVSVINPIWVEFSISEEVDNALIAHRNSKEALTVGYQRVRDLADYLHLATLQYENGLVDYLNVLDAERRLFDAQLDLAQEQATVFTTLVSLYKALGGGWVVDAENLMKECS